LILTIFSPNIWQRVGVLHGLRVFTFLYGVPEQPVPACRWLDIWHKAKSHICLFHVASVVMVKQQDGDKKKNWRFSSNFC
jgi:hypothetical protein